MLLLAASFVLVAALLSAEAFEDCGDCASIITSVYNVPEVQVPVDDVILVCGTQPAVGNNRTWWIEGGWLFISSENRSSEDVLESESPHQLHCSPAILFEDMSFDVDTFFGMLHDLEQYPLVEIMVEDESNMSTLSSEGVTTSKNTLFNNSEIQVPDDVISGLFDTYREDLNTEISLSIFEAIGVVHPFTKNFKHRVRPSLKNYHSWNCPTPMRSPSSPPVDIVVIVTPSPKSYHSIVWNCLTLDYTTRRHSFPLFNSMAAINSRTRNHKAVPAWFAHCADLFGLAVGCFACLVVSINFSPRGVFPKRSMVSIAKLRKKRRAGERESVGIGAVTLPSLQALLHIIVRDGVWSLELKDTILLFYFKQHLKRLSIEARSNITKHGSALYIRPVGGKDNNREADTVVADISHPHPAPDERESFYQQQDTNDTEDDTMTDISHSQSAPDEVERENLVPHQQWESSITIADTDPSHPQPTPDEGSLVLHQQRETNSTEDDTKMDTSHPQPAPDKEKKETSIPQQQQDSPTQPTTHSTPAHHTDTRHTTTETPVDSEEREMNELISQYKLKEAILKQVCNFFAISTFIAWFEVGRHLPEISWDDIRDIKKDGHNEKERRWLLMDCFRGKCGKNATNEVMLRAMLKSGMRSNADRLCELLTSKSHPTASQGSNTAKHQTKEMGYRHRGPHFCPILFFMMFVALPQYHCASYYSPVPSVSAPHPPSFPYCCGPTYFSPPPPPPPPPPPSLPQQAFIPYQMLPMCADWHILTYTFTPIYHCHGPQGAYYYCQFM